MSEVRLKSLFFFVINPCSVYHYLSAPPQAMWEGWGSPETLRALAGKQALGGHPSRRQCSGRTPQGPQQGCLTGVPAPGRLGTPSAHHLHTHTHTHRQDVQKSKQSKPDSESKHKLGEITDIKLLTNKDLHRGQRVIFPVHVLCFVLRHTLLGARADGIELVPFLN